MKRIIQSERPVIKGFGKNNSSDANTNDENM